MEQRVRMQRRSDFQGLDVSLSSTLSDEQAQEVIACINQFCTQVLRYRYHFIFKFVNQLGVCGLVGADVFRHCVQVREGLACDRARGGH
jgi:hypothetical protein